MSQLANDRIRGLMQHLPRAESGRLKWALDDVIALKINVTLIEAGFRRPAASDIAGQVRELLRHHDSEVFYLVREETPTGPVPRVLHVQPTKDQPILLRLSIGKMRAALEAPFVRFAS